MMALKQRARDVRQAEALAVYYQTVNPRVRGSKGVKMTSYKPGKN